MDVIPWANIPLMRSNAQSLDLLDAVVSFARGGTSMALALNSAGRPMQRRQVQCVCRKHPPTRAGKTVCGVARNKIVWSWQDWVVLAHCARGSMALVMTLIRHGANQHQHTRVWMWIFLTTGILMNKFLFDPLAPLVVVPVCTVLERPSSLFLPTVHNQTGFG